MTGSWKKEVYYSLPESETVWLNVKQKLIPPLHREAWNVEIFCITSLGVIDHITCHICFATHTVFGVIFGGLSLHYQLCPPNLSLFHAREENGSKLWRKWRFFVCVTYCNKWLGVGVLIVFVRRCNISKCNQSVQSSCG